MEERPKIKIPLSTSDKIIEVTALLLLIIMWAAIFLTYRHLPIQVPLHFNAEGEIDRFGHKAELFIVPGIATLLYIALSFLSRYPHIFSYMRKVHRRNAKILYTNSIKILRLMKLIMMFIFCAIMFFSFRAAFTGAGLEKWFVPVSIVLLLLPNLYFFKKA